MSTRKTQQATDREIAFYNPASNNYDLAKDPRCLWGWGGDCGHHFGHACFRPYRHEGRCWEAGDKPEADDPKCYTSRRPADWDDRGRAEANR